MTANTVYVFTKEIVLHIIGNDLAEYKLRQFELVAVIFFLWRI